VHKNDQPDTESNPNPNPNPNPTIRQHTIGLVSMQLNIVTCTTYPDKFIRDNVVAPSVLLSVVIVTLSSMAKQIVRISLGSVE